MTDAQTFVVSPRSIHGKKTKQLRLNGLIPANIMGDVAESISIQVPQLAFEKLYAKVGDTSLLYLEIEGEKGKRPVLIDDVTFDPITDVVEHVVFKQVDLKEKVTAEVAVELIGEVGVADGVVVQVKDVIEVEALPTDLPEKFEVDISILTEIGQSILISDLKFDRSKVTLMMEEEELSGPIVLVQEQQQEEVVEAEVTPEGDAQPETPTTEDASAKE